MGRVSDTVRERVLRQVEEHGVVVWFDPERAYAGIPESLSVAGAKVVRYEGSVFGLRRDVEQFLAADERPRAVVYVPASESDLGSALAELVAAGVTLRPGQQPVALNTRLSVVGRAALGALLPPDALEAVVRQVDSGQLGLADLDQLAESGVTASTGTLSLLFGTSQPTEIALLFVADRDRDTALVEKGAVADLESLLSVEYGLPRKGSTSPGELRDRFALMVLASDLIEGLEHAPPPALQGLPQPTRPELARRARELAATWRNRRDLLGAYVDRATRMERDLALNPVALPLRDLAAVETFRGLEEQLQDAVEASLLQAASPEVLGIAASRLQGFWAAAAPELMDRWALVLSIGRVLAKAEELGRVLSSADARKLDAAQIARQYVDGSQGAEPWALLDTYHRQMERRYHLFDEDLTGEGGHRSVESLVAKARARYAQVVSALCERFLDAFRASGFAVLGLTRQAEVFQRFVQPEVESGRRVAYVLVDGLRYEMAHELHGGMGRDHDVSLAALLGTLPSVTEVGMAAVLPGAHRGMELVAVGGGKLGIRLGTTLLRDRRERLRFLEQQVGVPAYSARLEDLLPASRKTREAIQAARLVVVTATDELDGLCERGNVAMARRLMDDVLLQIRRGLRVLFDLGVEVAVVTADHGHLFGEALDAGSTIDPPGGETADLHRRVWVGKGGAASPSYLRVKASDVGLSGDLELALPWALAGFKTPGASAAYFHGGASPQELLIPVWNVARKVAAARGGGQIEWRLTLGSAVISASFLSVRVDGALTGLFTAEAPLLRLEVREGKKGVSRPVASSYGFEEATGFVQMKVEEEDGKRLVRPNTVTLMLEERPAGARVEVVAVDVATDRILAKLSDVPVKLAGF